MPDNNVQIGEWWTIRDYSIGDPPEDPQFYFRIENIVEDDITLMNPLSGLVIVSGFNFYDIYAYAPWYTPRNTTTALTNFTTVPAPGHGYGYVSENSMWIDTTRIDTLEPARTDANDLEGFRQAILTVLGLIREDLNTLYTIVHPLQTIPTGDEQQLFTRESLESLRQSMERWGLHPDPRDMLHQPLEQENREHLMQRRAETEKMEPLSKTIWDHLLEKID